MSKKEEYFQILGHITVFFSTLDYLTTELIIKITKSEAEPKIRDSMTLKQKFRVLENYKEEDVVDVGTLYQVQAILPSAIVIAEKRNRFIHDQWVFDEKTLKQNKILRLKLKGFAEHKIDTEHTMHTNDDFTTLLSEIGQMQISIGEIIKNIK